MSDHFHVTNATRVNASNWVMIAQPQGPWDGPGAYSGNGCTLTASGPIDWTSVRVTGGNLTPLDPQTANLNASKPGKIKILAGGTELWVWVLWVEITIHTSGARPPRSVPFSEGAMFVEPGKCGAFTVMSFSMGENARGQVVAEANIEPKGIGRLLKAAGVADKWVLRREVTAHDFADGRRSSGKKSFKPWAEDTSSDKLMMLDPSASDRLYDSDAPELPTVQKIHPDMDGPFRTFDRQSKCCGRSPHFRHSPRVRSFEMVELTVCGTKRSFSWRD